MKDTTLLIKSFLRPKCLSRLLHTINLYFPTTSVIVADDSPPIIQEEISKIIKAYQSNRLTFLKLPFDVGLTVGRNRLVDAANTPYVILFDDDYVLDHESKLDILVSHLRQNTYDLVGGCWKMPNGRIDHFAGYMEIKDSILHFTQLEQYEQHQKADIVLNFFAAKTNTLRNLPWDENLKQSEHFDFFLQYKQHEVRVGYEPNVRLIHDRRMPKGYREFRMRYIHDRKVMFKKWGITKFHAWPAPKANN